MMIFSRFDKIKISRCSSFPYNFEPGLTTVGRWLCRRWYESCWRMRCHGVRCNNSSRIMSLFSILILRVNVYARLALAPRYRSAIPGQGESVSAPISISLKRWEDEGLGEWTDVWIVVYKKFTAGSELF